MSSGKQSVCVWPFQSHSCYTPSDGDSVSLSSEFTGEEVLGSQVADTQAEDGEFVQSGGDLLGERQQAGQTLQLPVQPVSMPFGRVGLGPFSRRLLHPDEHYTRRKKVNKQTDLRYDLSLGSSRSVSFCLCALDVLGALS